MRDDELLIERTFNAPLALVYRLWESRDHLLRWWGPGEFTAVEFDWELTPGRPWRGAMRSPEQGLYRFSGVIREVEPQRRIVFTFQWDRDDGRDPDTLVTVSFAEQDGKTVQTFHQAPFTSVSVRDSHIEGWSSLLNKQQRYAENLATSEHQELRT